MMVGIPQRNSICPTCPDCLGASLPAVAWIVVLVAWHFDCRRHSGLSLEHYKISFSSLSLSVCVSLISMFVDLADTLSVPLMLFVFIRFNHRQSLQRILHYIQHYVRCCIYYCKLYINKHEINCGYFK